MANRFFEEVDPVLVLVRGNIAQSDKNIEADKEGKAYAAVTPIPPEDSHPTVTTGINKEIQPRRVGGGISSSSSPSAVIRLLPRAEEKLAEGLRQTHPILLPLRFSDPDLEEGYRLFHNSNHLLYILLFVLSQTDHLFQISSGSEPSPPLWASVSSFFILTITLGSIFFVVRGSPLRLKDAYSRAALHEWVCILCGHTIILDSMGNFATSFECNDADRLRCVATAASSFLVNLSFATLSSQRIFLTGGVFIVSLGFSVVSQIMAHGTSTHLVTTTVPSLTVPVGALIFLFGIIYAYEQSQRQVFSSSLYLAVKKLKTEAAHDQASGVMATLLPLSVLKPVVRGEPVFHTAEATVVQADVCHFTQWCANRNSTQVVEMLSSVMSAFDETVTANNCTRIKVLGDGYIACAGLPDLNEAHAECGVLFAVSLQGVLAQCCAQNEGLEWGRMEVRAGVHSGLVSAGVLSKQRWAYDIYGEVPRIVNMLEPAANAGGVLVSETTFNLLPSHVQRSYDVKQGPSVQTTGGSFKGTEQEQGGAEKLKQLLKTFEFGGPNDLEEDPDAIGKRRESIVKIDDSEVSGPHRSQQGAQQARVLLTQGLAEAIGGTIAERTRSHIAGAVSILDESQNIYPENRLTSTASTSGIPQQEEEEDGLEEEIERTVRLDEDGEDMTNPLLHVDLADDPTPQVYAQLTRTIALASFLSVLVGLLAWGLAASDPKGSEIEFILAVLALAVNAVCQCIPSTAVKSAILVSYLGISIIIIAPLMERTSPFSTVFFGVAPLAFTPYLPYKWEWMPYVFFVVTVIIAQAMLVLIVDDYAPSTSTMFFITLSTIAALSLLRFVFKKRIRMLKMDAMEASRHLCKLRKENATLETVLRLKMPSHVVGRLFAEDSGTGILNASYVIPSCLIAFAHFKLPPTTKLLDNGAERANFDVLHAMNRVIDTVLPTDGSGRLRYLEKIKTIGDVVMMGGSVIPGECQYVSDEEVLLELLYVMEYIDKEVRGEELLVAEECQCLMGVHKGEVTTATIGKVNLEYDVFGATVNTAARLLASTDSHSSKAQFLGQAPRVFEGRLVAAVCSDSVLEVLHVLMARIYQKGTNSLRPDLSPIALYEGTERRTLTGKGIGEMATYLLTAQTSSNHISSPTKMTPNYLPPISSASDTGREDGDTTTNC